MTPENYQDIIRKREEAEFHDKIRSDEVQSDPKLRSFYTSNVKFYSITRASKTYYEKLILQRCRNKRVLDYCCGGGYYAMFAATHGAKESVGIDISQETIRFAVERVTKHNLADKVSFKVMDAEALEFENESFDLIIESGALHHLDLRRAWSEMNRVLRSDGQAICMEALGHNPLIQWYRQRTPHLRTVYETKHILTYSAIHSVLDYFGKVDIKYFHFLSLAAVPLRGRAAFEPLLKLLEVADSVFLRLPLIRNMAWIVVFVLSKPRKDCNADQTIAD